MEHESIYNFNYTVRDVVNRLRCARYGFLAMHTLYKAIKKWLVFGSDCLHNVCALDIPRAVYKAYPISHVYPLKRKPVMTANFVHLSLHSEYSMSDGIISIKNLVKMAENFSMPAVTITDKTNLFATVKLFTAAMKAKIKPLIAAELYLFDATHDKQPISQFTAFCLNSLGYNHLTQLVSEAYLTGQAPGIPTITWQQLVDKQAGLLILSGGCYGNVGQALIANDHDKANHLLQQWQSVFQDRFYIELHRTQRHHEEGYLHLVLPLSEKYDIPLVATNAVCFATKADFEAHEARVCIHSGHVLMDPKRPRNFSEEQYFKSPEEMAELFADIPEAIENTVEIAKRCSMPLSLGKHFLPIFPTPAGVTLEDHLQAESKAGLEKILAKSQSAHRQVYDDRLKIELAVINNMGFPSYFLIVADFIAWAKNNDIPVGPGRGSGAGSLVAYALGITELDPIKHDLLFERFLNPERVSLPDFDIDFCMDQRDAVIDYVAKKYGRESVSQIITYGTMTAKAVVRDVGRVLGMPYIVVDKISKLIPFEIGMTLTKAMEDEPQLQERYDQEEEVKTLIDLALKLEGITRNAGKHAGGVVIAPTKLTDFTAVYCEASGEHPVSQFDKDDVESVGLVKFDFLGLRTLTIIHWCLQNITQRAKLLGEDKQVDITTIPTDDELTFKLLKSNQTIAVFQLESRGMRDLIRRVQPDCFDEITALVALFRPGPLQSGMVDDFIDRKHGRAPVNYPHPDLEPILKSTYGVILYQEQVMQIAQVLANYSLGGADLLRRAMGKKKPEEMAKQREIFTQGAKQRGVDENVATHIFDLMEKFAGYGFNKSHSAAYALIAYQTAWLKAHYPAEFMAAVLSSDLDNTDKIVIFIDECQRMQQPVLPPCINAGHIKFEVTKAGELVYGLGAIKGVGEAALEGLLQEREANGPYHNLFELCERNDARKLNKRVLESLVYAGALDCFGVERSWLQASIPNALKMAEQKHKNAGQGQLDLFAEIEPQVDLKKKSDYTQVAAWDDKTRLDFEKQTLGYYLSGHPLGAFVDELKGFVTCTIKALNPDKSEVVIAGLVTGARIINSKRGRMAVLTLEDLTGSVEVTLFSDLYYTVQPLIYKDNIIVVTGEPSVDDFSGGVRVLGKNVHALSQARQNFSKKLSIEFAADDSVETLQALLMPYVGGPCYIELSLKRDHAIAKMQFGSNWRVNLQDALLVKLREQYGIERVKVVY